MFLFRDTILLEKTEIKCSLKNIYSLSWYKSNLLLNLMGLTFPYFVKNLNFYNINFLLFLLKGSILSDTRIKRNIDLQINHLISINCYKGIRHKMNLPVRGQRTRTNASTQRNKNKRI